MSERLLIFGAISGHDTLSTGSQLIHSDVQVFSSFIFSTFEQTQRCLQIGLVTDVRAREKIRIASPC